MVSDFLGDLRYAARALGRSPGFSLLAIAIMALGIGANTAVFTVVNAVLLKPLPYPGADRIVTVTSRNVATGEINLLNFRDWRDQSSSFEAMATYRGGEAPVTPGDTAEYGQHANVDGQFFRVLGVEPIIGRTFTAEELEPGSNQPAALISHAFWQSRHGADPEILKKTIRVGNTPRPIVGVLPAGFHFPRRTDIWSNQTTRETSRTRQIFLGVARLKPDVSLRQAQTELTAIGARLEQQYPESNQGRGVRSLRGRRRSAGGRDAARGLSSRAARSGVGSDDGSEDGLRMRFEGQPRTRCVSCSGITSVLWAEAHSHRSPTRCTTNETIVVPGASPESVICA